MSDFRKVLPSPIGKTYEVWSRELYTYLSDDPFEADKTPPKIVALSHQLPTTLYRTTQSGLMMYDPVLKKVVVSIDGVWTPL